MLWWISHLSHSFVLLFGFIVALLLLLVGYAYNKKKFTLKSIFFCVLFLALLSCVELNRTVNFHFTLDNLDDIDTRFEDGGTGAVNTVIRIIQFVISLLN